MGSYENFARVYDEFMDQTPYDLWCDHILKIFSHYHVPQDGSILELGCGTGKMTRRLAAKGYELTAIDSSLDMLEIARSKTEDPILYVFQDMTELELPGKVDAAFSVCDCMNYLLEEEDLLETFRRVRKYLKLEGVFFFDMNSRYKYEHLLAQNTFAEDREDASFIWDNFYDEEERVNEYQISLFLRNPEGTYDKFEEDHFQKAYEIEEVRDLLYQAGFEKVRALDAESLEEPAKESQRICYIAQ